MSSINYETEIPAFIRAKAMTRCPTAAGGAMTAADVMTREPISVGAQTTIVEAAQLMLRHRISGLPVTDGNDEIIGVVTEGDLLRRAETGTERHRSTWLAFLVGPGHLAGDYVGTHARKVGEVMTRDVAVVAPSHDLAV